jgi:hypothetical protein
LALYIRMGLCMRDQWRWQIHSVVVGLVLSSLYPLPIVDLELTIRFFSLLLLSSQGSHRKTLATMPSQQRTQMIPRRCFLRQHPFRIRRGLFLGRLCVFDSATGTSSANNACPIFGTNRCARHVSLAARRVQYQAIQNQNHGAVGTDVGAPLRRSTADD